MQRVIPKLFLSVLFMLFILHVAAQSCTGSLGDPVINQDFGSGTNPGAPLPAGTTTMTYTPLNCPVDGHYTIANSITGDGNCEPNAWHNVPNDHTGNPNGYMMIVNASASPSIFFTQKANGLCPNTTYEFSAYVLNLVMLEVSVPGVNQPNILFSIETTSGQSLATYTTGTIAPTPKGQLTWNQYSVFFTTPDNVTDVVVKMNNLSAGGNGNDLILDDITFRACGPVIQVGFGSDTGPDNVSLCQGGDAKYTVNATVRANGSPDYQWQSNINGGAWADMAGQTEKDLNITFTDAVTGAYQYRLGVSNGSDVSSAQCRVYSSPVTATVNPVPVVPEIAPQTICEGASLTLSASGGVSYLWSGPNLAPTSQNPLIINNVTAANAGIYTVDVSNGFCNGNKQSVPVTVIQNPVANAGDNKAIFEGQSVKLNGSVVDDDNNYNFYWTPTTALNDPNSLTPIATPDNNITYTLTAISKSCGISSVSNMSVKVYKTMNVPNAFSPNNDGINDYWSIDALAVYPNCRVVVYDRYGHQVYQSTGYGKPWDGNYGGSPLAQGTYYYTIDLKNNTPKLTGWVIVVR